MTKITAHSGSDGTPADSLESIEYAVEKGADIVEVDVRMTKGGELRLSHDCPADGDYSGKPTLREMFRCIADSSCGINCDIKEFRCIEPTLRLAEEFHLGPDRLILTGSVSPNYLVTDPTVVERAGVYLNLEEILKVFCAGDLVTAGRTREIPELLDRSWGYLQRKELVDRYTDDIITLLQGLHVRGLNMPHALVTEVLLDKLREKDIPLSLWTVQDTETADRVLGMGVFNMTTTILAVALERRESFFSNK